MTARSQWISRHRLPVFFGLAFLLSWSSLAAVFLGLLDQIEFQSWGPLAAAVIVISLTEGTNGLRTLGSRLTRWRVGVLWWAVALILPVAAHLAVAALNAGFGGPAVDLASLSWGSLLAAFAVRLVMPLDGPMGEEPGWRGYAVPELQQRFSPLASAAILGALVAAWHLPLIFGGSLDGVIDLATTFVITFVYVWLFNRSGGSLLLVLVFHAAEGIVQETAFGAQGADLARTSWILLVVWTVVALSVVVLDRSAWRRPAVGQPAAAAESTARKHLSV